MSRGAKAFRASLTHNDSGDACDSSALSVPLEGKSVATVSSVMAALGKGKQPGDGVSTSSTAAPHPPERVAGAPANHPLTGNVKASLPGARIHAVTDATADTCSQTVAGLAMHRPPSWADPAELPLHGSWCRCCRGSRWWSERKVPRGWRCWTCHPPDHLPVDATRTVHT
jgi:hypothetical protein